MFIAFIECKIEGSWMKKRVNSGTARLPRLFEYLEAQNSETCKVHVIEPDGLRRIFLFTAGATIDMNQNILSYNPNYADEITVDEQEQSGRGRTSQYSLENKLQELFQLVQNPSKLNAQRLNSFLF